MKIKTRTYLLYCRLISYYLQNKNQVTVEELRKKEQEFAKEVNAAFTDADHLENFIELLKSKLNYEPKSYSVYFKNNLHRFAQDINNDLSQLKEEFNISFGGEKHITNSYEDFCNKTADAQPQTQSIESYAAHLNSYFNGAISQGAKPHRSIPDYGLRNTWWFVYYHEFDNESCFTLITRNILYIDNEYKAVYYTLNEQDYKSRPFETYLNTNKLQLFTTFNDNSNLFRMFELKLQVNKPVKPETLITGQLLHFTEQNYCITTTIVLQACKVESINKSELLKSRIVNKGMDVECLCLQIYLAHTANWQNFIPLEVARFLEHRKFNVLKTKIAINDMSDIAAFNEAHDKEVTSRERYNSIINYDLFVIAPHNSIDAMLALQLNTEIDKVFFKYPTNTVRELLSQNAVDIQQNELKKYEASDEMSGIGITKIFYPSRIHSIEQGDGTDFFRTPQELFNTELKAMKHSRAVLCILTEGLLRSTAYLKIGWAISLQRSVFVFSPSKQSLPSILNNSHNGLITIANHDRYPMNKSTYINEIPAYLKTDKEMKIIDKL